MNLIFDLVRRNLTSVVGAIFCSSWILENGSNSDPENGSNTPQLKLKKASAEHILFSTEGRGVGLCWALSKPKGPKERV